MKSSMQWTDDAPGPGLARRAAECCAEAARDA